MQKFFFSVIILNFYLCTANCQNIGIGTKSPSALLHVSEGSVLFSATGPAPILAYNPPASGMGRRTMWYADKAAFRTGFVSNNAWDKDSIGYYSFAAGYDAKATDVGAMAFSHYAQARGIYSIAMGYNTKANNPNSVSIGSGTLAAADGAIALGHTATASGVTSVSIGSNSNATGAGSVALGSAAKATYIDAVAIGGGSQASGWSAVAFGGGKASGSNSIAMGTVTASGGGSIAIGENASTNDKIGACVIADNTNKATLYSSANYQISMRFSGGYRFYTDYFLTTGVQLAFGGGSWTALCDRRRKENFLAVNNEELLKKVASLPITNWNYKTQPKTQRHIGPMAQDFYAAFHLDGEGADTTINTMDISGVNMAAIQALEKRTADLKRENEKLRANNDELAAVLAEIKTRLQNLEKLQVH
jgi:hypothetical protein